MLLEQLELSVLLLSRSVLFDPRVECGLFGYFEKLRVVFQVLEDARGLV